MTATQDPVRSLHRTIDQRIANTQPQTPPPLPKLGVVDSITPNLFQAAVVLDGGTDPTPYVVVPALPVELAVGDLVMVDVRSDGSRIISAVLGRTGTPAANLQPAFAIPSHVTEGWFWPDLSPVGDTDPAPYQRDTTTAQKQAFFTDPVEVASVLANVTTFVLFSRTAQATAASDVDMFNLLVRLFPQLRAHGVKLALAMAGPYGYAPGVITLGLGVGTNGSQSATYDLAHAIANVEALGGSVDYVIIDGGLRRTIVNGWSTGHIDQNATDAATEVVSYMQTVNAGRPNIRYVLLEDIVVWPYGASNGTTIAGYDGAPFTASSPKTGAQGSQRPDFYTTLESFISQLTSAGILNLLPAVWYDSSAEYDEGLISSANSTADDWYGRIFQVQAQVESHGLLFGKLWNSTFGHPAAQPPSSDKEFQEGTLRHIDEAASKRNQLYPTSPRMGQYVGVSFYYFPRNVGPSTVAYSMTDTYLRGLSRYLGKFAPAPAGALATAHVPGDTYSRFKVELDATGRPRIGLGSGTVPVDVVLSRSGPYALGIDADGAGGPANLNVTGILRSGGLRYSMYTAASITANVNDYSPTGTAGTDALWTLWRLPNNGSAHDITGFLAGSRGDMHVIVNTGTGTETLKHESASSVAQNRLYCPGAADVAIPQHGVAIIWYDDITARWRVQASRSGGVVRSVFIPYKDLSNDGGTPATLGTAPTASDVVTLADAATQGVYCDLWIPADWASGNVSIRPFWVPGSTDAVAHTVRWSANLKVLGSAADVTTGGVTTTWTGASAARTTPQIVTNETLTDLGVSGVANTLFRLSLRRVGADAADTYVGAVHLKGIDVRYTAGQ